MILSKMRRTTSHDDPERCTATYKHGPCPYKAVANAKNCEIHGGVGQANTYERQIMFQYRADKWEQKIRDFANDSGIKSLRQEIGVARMLLEETLNKCSDATELMLYSTKIVALVDQINKLVISCTKLEDRLGVVIDKSTVLNLGEQILQVIKEFLPEDKFELVASKIVEAINTAGDPLALEDLT